MKNVKVILISVALCATVFANQRIAALGGDEGFWSGDRMNVGSFPATINDHAFVEIDGVGDAGGVDATILWGDATKWGFNFNGDDANSWFNIMWGSNGMGLSVSYIANDDGMDGNDDPSGFHVGYGKNFDWGELGVGFMSGVGDENNNSWNNDASCYWANWRSSMDAWVFDTAKASFRMDDDGGDNSTMTLGFDMFTHLDAGGADVLFGLGTDYVSWDGAGDAGGSSMTLPSATLAVEAALTDWATVRAFANHTYTFSCDDEYGALGCGDESSNADDNSTAWGFGLGFDWGQLNLDMSIGTDLFTDPMSMITGYDDGGLADGAVTLSYTF